MRRNSLGPRLDAPRVLLGAALLALAACAGPSEQGEGGSGPGAAGAGENVRPRELALEAHQVGGRILVVARGENSTGGFDTGFVLRADGELVLRNVPPKEAAIQMITPFEHTGWVPANGTPSSLKVHVAGEERTIEVKRAPRVATD